MTDSANDELNSFLKAYEGDIAALIPAVLKRDKDALIRQVGRFAGRTIGGKPGEAVMGWLVDKLTHENANTKIFREELERLNEAERQVCFAGLVAKELSPRLQDLHADVRSYGELGSFWFERLDKKIDALMDAANRGSEFAVPPLPELYTRDAAAMARFADAIRSNQVVQLVGVSGAGKTRLVSDWAREQSPDSVWWVSASELPTDYDLAGRRTNRLGMRQNLANRIGRPGSTLVVDDFHGDLSQLLAQWREHRNETSRLVLTSQVASPNAGAVVTLCGVSLEVARRILPSDLDDSGFQQVYDATGGVPMALILCRGLIDSDDMLNTNHLLEVVREIHSEETGTGTTVAHAILQRHLNAIGSELAILRWLGSQLHAETFLRDVLGHVGFNKIKRRALLQAEAQGVWKLHDLIWRSILLVDLPDMSDTAKEKLGQYLVKHADNKVRHVRLSLSFMESKLCELRPKTAQHGLWAYNYLQLDAAEDTPNLIDELASTPAPGCDEWTQWASWIEAKERLSRSSRASERYVEESAELLEAARSTTTDARSLAMLAHHAGKFYARAKRNEDADRCFQQALSDGRVYPEVRLAQARLARRTSNFPEGAIIIEQLVEQRFHNGLSVGLAAYAELVNYPDLLKRYVVDDKEGFIDFIQAAKVEGFSQPEDTIRAVCRGLEYSCPHLVLTLADSVESPEPAELGSQSDRIAWAEYYLIWAACLSKLGRALSAQARTALELFEAAASKHSFHLSRWAKCLLLDERPEETLKLLASETDLFCRFYRAQALVGSSKVQEAQAEIREVIAEAAGKQDRYTWDFYRWLGRIEAKAGEPGRATDAYRVALAKCPKDAAIELADIQKCLANLGALEGAEGARG